MRDFTDGRVAISGLQIEPTTNAVPCGYSSGAAGPEP